MSKKELTVEFLRDMLSHDPDTGLFSWRKNRRKARVGVARTVCDKDGYLLVCFNYKRHRVHRLAWFYHHGEWPKGQIDHIDGDKQNNRLHNLRDVSVAQNQQNRLRPTRRNTTGFPGVSFEAQRGMFVARISAAGEKKFLGRFDTALNAYAAYLEAKQRLHPGCHTHLLIVESF